MRRILAIVIFFGILTPAFTGGPKKGDASAAVAVTQGPKHHFVGYYDITPSDKTERYLLANAIGFIDRQPKPGEALTVGMVDLETKRYIAFDTTTAWCWQMGTRLQWLGSARS